MVFSPYFLHLHEFVVTFIDLWESPPLLLVSRQKSSENAGSALLEVEEGHGLSSLTTLCMHPSHAL